MGARNNSTRQRRRRRTLAQVLALMLLALLLVLLVLLALSGKAGDAMTRVHQIGGGCGAVRRIGSEDGVEVTCGERVSIFEAVILRGEEVAHRAVHGLKALLAVVETQAGGTGGGRAMNREIITHPTDTALSDMLRLEIGGRWRRRRHQLSEV